MNSDLLRFTIPVIDREKIGTVFPSAGDIQVMLMYCFQTIQIIFDLLLIIRIS